MTMQPNHLLTISDVAEQLQVERHKASELMKLMPCLVMPGTRTRRVRQADFQKWIDSNTVQPVAPTEKRTRKKPEAIDPNLFEPDGRIKRRRKGG